MAERYTAIIGKQIRAAVAADGLQKDASQNLAVDVSDFAGTGLEDDGSENLRIATTAAGDGLTGGGGSALAVGAGDGIDVAADSVAVDVTDFIDTDYGLTENANDIRLNVSSTFFEFATGALSLKDGGIPEAKLDINTAAGAGVDGYVLYWNNGAGKLDYKEVVTPENAVTEADIVANEIPTGDIDGLNTSYTLANTPVSTSVQVYLNGIMQAPGSGKDYQLSGDTIAFADAPESGAILLVNYIINN